LTALVVTAMGPAAAVTPSNARSPLGINLSSVNDYTGEQPFINIFVTNGGWITHGRTKWDTHEEQYLRLDANGYPTTLAASQSDPDSPQIFSSVGVLLERQGGQYLYPAGRYVVRYDGDGKLVYGFDARLVSSSPGRDVIDVARPSDAGIDLRITLTDPKHNGNYIRAIALVRIQDEAAFESGQLFNPVFLDLLKNFHVLRFMDWLHTNGSTLSSWSSRRAPSYYSWAGNDGVPLEVAIRLANAVSADAWLNVPAMGDNEYIKQMAVLVHGQLGSTQRVYVEYSNEVWNRSFSQYRYAGARGREQWPNRPPGSDNYEWNRNWYGMRTAQICDMWKSVWGVERDRVICVFGAQAAVAYSATDSLNCPYWTAGAPCSAHGIGAVAIAPYFGDGNLPLEGDAQAGGGLALLFRSLGSSDASGTSLVMDTLSDLAARLRAKLARHHLIESASGSEPGVPAGGWFHGISGWEASYKAILVHYHLPLIAYEGGQGFVGGSNASATKLFIAANRDSRMGTAYTTYLQQWKENGGELFVLYNDVGGYSQYGEWGALESIMQLNDSSAGLPPKWRAIQDFITSTACWWPGCADGGVKATGSRGPVLPRRSAN
jgi:hypothetical protein